MLLEFGPCLSWCVLHCIASFHESQAWHIFIRVDAETEVAYELIVELIQEPQEREQQEGAVEPTSEEVANSADLQGKSRSITLI